MLSSHSNTTQGRYFSLRRSIDPLGPDLPSITTVTASWWRYKAVNDTSLQCVRKRDHPDHLALRFQLLFSSSHRNTKSDALTCEFNRQYNKLFHNTGDWLLLPKPGYEPLEYIFMFSISISFAPLQSFLSYSSNNMLMFNRRVCNTYRLDLAY